MTTADLRHWMTLFEVERVGRTFPHKPLSEVTPQDIVRAMVETSDLYNVLINHWSQMDWGEDATGEPLDDPPMPRSFRDLSPEQYKIVADFYSDNNANYGSSVQRLRQELAPYAKMSAIPVSRRIKQLTDLTKPLGVHWSVGETANEGTEHYGGIVIFGSVAELHIDWITTLARGMFWFDEEQEIAVVMDSPILLTKITFPAGITAKA